MDLHKRINRAHIFFCEQSKSTDQFYANFSQFLKKQGIITHADKVKRLFIKRENIQTTAIGKGAAAPHIFSEEFAQFTVTLAIVQNGMDYKAPDLAPVHVVFLIMSDDRNVGLHLKSLAHIAKLVQNTDVVEALKNVKSPDEALLILKQNEGLL